MQLRIATTTTALPVKTAIYLANVSLLLADESAKTLEERDVALVLVLGAEVGELGGEFVADAAFFQHVHQQVVEYLEFRDRGMSGCWCTAPPDISAPIPAQ